MSAMTGVIAGIATLAGVLALYRFAARRTRGLRVALDEARGKKSADASVLDFEQDPDTGVYHAK
ncbi:MAG: hypothetical protein AB7P23_03695 [Amphiplicatus sp.]